LFFKGLNGLLGDGLSFFIFSIGKNLSGDNIGFRLEYFKVFNKIRYQYEGKTFF
jgi:hypothetical protein